MNKLDPKTRSLIIRLLVEGNSIRATSRIADVSKNTVNKLLIDAGKNAADLLNVSERSVKSARKVLERGAPELVEALERGDLAVFDAANIAETFYRDEQEQLSKGGPEGPRARGA